MENNFDVNEIVKIEKLPKIFYQLEKVGQYIDENLKDIKEMECTEENKKVVKKRRTEINNLLKEFETKRKGIKTQILESYSLFEAKYSSEVKTRLESASNELSEKINVIEETQKKEKEQILRKFFKEYQQMYHLEDIVKFEDMNLNITLSASEKSLKDDVCLICQRIANEVNIINQEEYREEVMLEYINCGFDYIKAKTKILEQKKRMKEIQDALAKKGKIEADENGVIEQVNTLVSAPQKIEEKDMEILECNFKVKTTRENLHKLKQFLKENQIEYE